MQHLMEDVYVPPDIPPCIQPPAHLIQGLTPPTPLAAFPGLHTPSTVPVWVGMHSPPTDPWSGTSPGSSWQGERSGTQ